MTARLILIAHAETEATRAARFPSEDPLTPSGLAATERLKRCLPDFKTVWCSPAPAARGTAAVLEPRTQKLQTFACDPMLYPFEKKDAAYRLGASTQTADALASDAIVDAALADLDCGTWRGETLASLVARDPAGIAAWRADPRFVGHGGCSIEALLGRVAGWLDARRSEQGSSLAVTHAAVVRCAVLAVLGAPPAGFWHIEVAPLSRVDLSSDGRRWTLRHMSAADP